MNKFLLLGLLTLLFARGYALNDTCVVPLSRQLLHAKIHAAQKECDNGDGVEDGKITVSVNEEMNNHISELIFKKISEIENNIECDEKIASSNEKVRYLNYLNTLLVRFRSDWKSKKFNPTFTPVLINNFEKILQATIEGKDMSPLIDEVPFEVGRINASIFEINPGYEACKKILFLKYSELHPGEILANIHQFADEPFADSLIVLACNYNPKQVYDYAGSTTTIEGKLIHRSTNPLVKIVAKLSQTPNALFYYPFLDNLLREKISFDSIGKYVRDGEKKIDSIGYFKLMVKTESEYYDRLIAKDTPIALFGPNGLRDMLHRKSIEYFVNPINELHEQNNLNIRMKSIDPLAPEDIYYMMVMGENEIYTSSYKHSFERLIQKMGPKPRGDKLLQSVNFDYFKKFIKMAANFNQLDTFLRTMPERNSTTLMKAFVDNLDEANNLEDAVDVADSYSSIKDKKLLNTILENIKLNEQRSIEENNYKGKVVYGLLKTIFLSADNDSMDISAEIGIPSIFSVENKYLSDDSDRIIEQVFFYGDEDGKKYYPGFINSFSKTEWKITPDKDWVEIKSIKGKKVWIFVNRPLDSDKNLDDTAQARLSRYLYTHDMNPSIVVHRGHSYWLPGTIARMTGGAKIIVLGSCGGYKNLNQILDGSPDANIISTKEIGKGDINSPIINYLNQAFQSGKKIVWKDMWATLDKVFYADKDRDVRESWDDYVPPYKNLGAIFIKAYNKKMESVEGK